MEALNGPLMEIAIRLTEIGLSHRTQSIFDALKEQIPKVKNVAFPLTSLFKLQLINQKNGQPVTINFLLNVQAALCKVHSYRTCF